jgi:putative ATP-dependent endonuclease of the OLD family
VIIDGDSKEHQNDDSTTAVKNAKLLEIENRVGIFEGNETLEIDLFPDKLINKAYLENCFINLGHSKSYSNLMEASDNWSDELLKRVDGTIKKGRFAQELAITINADFLVPEYIKKALLFIFAMNDIDVP